MQAASTPLPVPLPLQRYRLFHTQDLDEARERVARVFCPHKLQTLHHADALDACHHSARVQRSVSLNYVQYGPAVQIEPGCLKDFFLLQIPLRGGAEIRCGAQAIEATPRRASLPSPTEPLAMRWHGDSPHLIVRFERQALLEQLEALMQAPLKQPLVFELALELDQAPLASMLQFIDYLRAALDASGGLPGRLGEQAEHYLMTCLLMSAAHNHSRALDDGSRRALLPRVVRRAQEFMAAHAEQPLSLADICRQTGASARALQLAFRAHAGQSPMEFLRDLRLERVRAELLAGTAGGVAPAIAEVAARYGFLHLGHFAAQYRLRFGERPSQTRWRGG